MIIIIIIFITNTFIILLFYNCCTYDFYPFRSLFQGASSLGSFSVTSVFEPNSIIEASCLGYLSSMEGITIQGKSFVTASGFDCACCNGDESSSSSSVAALKWRIKKHLMGLLSFERSSLSLESICNFCNRNELKYYTNNIWIVFIWLL